MANNSIDSYYDLPKTQGSSHPNTHAVGGSRQSQSPTFPPDPAGTPSGSPPYDSGEFDFSQLYNLSGTGIINVLTNFDMFISAHPTQWLAQLNLAKAYINIFTGTGGNVPQAVQDFLNQGSGANLMADGIEMGAEFAFKNGYQGNPPGETSYNAFLNAWKGTIEGLNGYQNDSILSKLDNDVKTDLSNADTYNAQHTDPNTGAFGVNIGGTWAEDSSGKWTCTGGTWYDYNSTDSNTIYTIDESILNLGGSDVSSLNDALGKLKTQNMVSTIDQILNGGNVMLAIMAILSFMSNGELGYLNQIDGNNDTMNSQHELLTRFVNPIQTDVQGIYNWSSAWPTTGSDKAGIAGVHDLRENLQDLLNNQSINPQFSGLNNVMSQLTQYLNSNSVAYPPGNTSKPQTTVTLYNLLIKGTEDDGKTTISDADAASTLKNGLAPSPTTPTPGDPSPPGNNASTEPLQGFLGAIGAVSTEFSSISTQITTVISQLTQMVQALLKVGDGAIDPKNGLNAVTSSSVNHQIVS